MRSLLTELISNQLEKQSESESDFLQFQFYLSFLLQSLNLHGILIQNYIFLTKKSRVLFEKGIKLLPRTMTHEFMVSLMCQSQFGVELRDCRSWSLKIFSESESLLELKLRVSEFGVGIGAKPRLRLLLYNQLLSEPNVNP